MAAGGGDEDGKRDESECDKREKETERVEQRRPATTSLALMQAIQISQCTSNTISPSSCAAYSRSRKTRTDTADASSYPASVTRMHARTHVRTTSVILARANRYRIPRTKIEIFTLRKNHRYYFFNN